MEIKSKETTNFTLRMPVEARFQLEVIAAKESRTVTNLINMVLKEYIEKYNKTKNRGCEINRNPFKIYVSSPSGSSSSSAPAYLSVVFK